LRIGRKHESSPNALPPPLRLESPCLRQNLETISS
jgi:hypothetical protein